MALITYNVTATVTDQAGNPIQGATVTARLTASDVDPVDGIVTPETYTYTTDAAGQVVMALWPNARGSNNTKYAFRATDISGAVLFNGQGAVPEADTTLAAIITLLAFGGLQPYPHQDDTREARIIADVAQLMHDDDPNDQAVADRIARWIELLLIDANMDWSWDFLQNAASTTLGAGNDIIDLRGDVDRISAIYCPRRLHRISLGELTELRARAAANGYPNASKQATHFAIEARRRIHLWPAPSQPVSFAMLYNRPIHVAIVPGEWEAIILNGIIGKYGQHFDRDSLTQNQEAFEARYQRQLIKARKEANDVVVTTRFRRHLPPESVLAADSSVDTGTEFLAPASQTGLGYVSIETGDYPLVVQ